MKKKTLEIAVSKLTEFYDQYCACLTPAEVKALLDEGAKISGGYLQERYTRSTIEKKVEDGVGGRTWIYFSHIPKHLLGRPVKKWYQKY